MERKGADCEIICGELVSLGCIDRVYCPGGYIFCGK